MGVGYMGLLNLCPWRGLGFLGPPSCDEGPPGLRQGEEGAPLDYWPWTVRGADSLALGTLPWEPAAQRRVFGTFSFLI